jgi:hypothetical protein
MTLNPITYTENVVGDFLKYQLTTYGFADPRLRDQLRRLLSLDETRRTPLLQGFRNAYIHKCLDRRAAARVLGELGDSGAPSGRLDRTCSSRATGRSTQASAFTSMA